MVTVDDISVTDTDIELKEHEVYVFLILEEAHHHDFQLKIVTPAPNATIWKIVPQFLLLAFSKSIIATNYQTWLFQMMPNELKTLVAPLYFLTIILGNLLIIILTQIRFHDSEWHYGLFAALMVVDLCLILFLRKKFLKEAPDQGAPPTSLRHVVDQSKVIIL